MFGIYFIVFFCIVFDVDDNNVINKMCELVFIKCNDFDGFWNVFIGFVIVVFLIIFIYLYIYLLEKYWICFLIVNVFVWFVKVVLNINKMYMFCKCVNIYCIDIKVY